MSGGWEHPCPGCAIPMKWSREVIVPSDRRLREPEGVGVRYLMRGRQGFLQTVHKCPVTVSTAPNLPLSGEDADHG